MFQPGTHARTNVTTSPSTVPQAGNIRAWCLACLGSIEDRLTHKPALARIITSRWCVFGNLSTAQMKQKDGPRTSEKTRTLTMRDRTGQEHMRSHSLSISIEAGADRMGRREPHECSWPVPRIPAVAVVQGSAEQSSSCNRTMPAVYPGQVMPHVEL